jgi:hypothetical protein
LTLGRGWEFAATIAFGVGEEEPDGGTRIACHLDQTPSDSGEDFVEPLTHRHVLRDAPQDVQVPIALQRVHGGLDAVMLEELLI